MKGTTHAVVGINVLWLLPLLHLEFFWWLIPTAFLVALLPDLDASDAKIKHLEIGFGGRHSGLGLKPFAPLAILLHSLFGHRGLLHSLLGLAAIAIGLGLANAWWFNNASLYSVILLAYLSHLVLDAMTKSGIEFLFPWKRHLGLWPKALRVKTGGLVDNFLLVVGGAGVILFLLNIINNNDLTFNLATLVFRRFG